MLFEVWAPHARDRVTLELNGSGHPLERDAERDGWWTGVVPAEDGDRYGFALDGGPVLPDPRSPRLPDGPDGLGAVVDHSAYVWRNESPKLRLRGAVLYELHVGTFTPAGTLDAAGGTTGWRRGRCTSRTAVRRR